MLGLPRRIQPAQDGVHDGAEDGVSNGVTADKAAGVAAAAGEVDVLRALAHPVRWGILQRLAAEPGICACDFTEFFEVSQPTISAHLKVLRETGLVTTRRNGTTICYSIAPGQLARVGEQLTWMAGTAGQDLRATRMARELRP